MSRAAKGKSAWALVLGLAAVLLAAALPAPAIASAPSLSYAETRVWGFELQIPAGVGAERGLSVDGTRGYGEAYDELAVGYPLVPRGTGQSLQRFFPPNQGFLGEAERVFLRPGQRIDRFGGSEFSRFLSPAGTPQAARALPPGTAGQPLRTFEVLKPFEVEAGTVAPAFGELGFGTQIRTPVTLKVLIERGIIREVTP